MNDNVFLIISKQAFELTEKNVEEIKIRLASELKPYFGRLLKIVFVDQADKNAEIIIMDKAKYPDSDERIKQRVRALLSTMLPKLDIDQIGIKINYAKFNPNYNPVISEEKGRTSAFGSANEVPRKEVPENSDRNVPSEEFDYVRLSQNYHAETPKYSFDQVILPEKTLEQIENAIGILEVEKKVFDEWGLRSIIPTASSALSFYGPPGTGKTMAAEAIAQKLGKKILSATYADIESKYHGEGPKMVKAIFMAAERDDAVLFLDESDSLLSKRLTNVSDGSSQAINSMRSQLLISLEHFKGIVIFATNLVVNYDRAFLSRLINIEFTMPTAIDREKIWWRHLKTPTVHVPLASDVDIKALAEAYDFCGREIKSSVKNACVSAALAGKDCVSQDDFVKACETTKEEGLKAARANDHTVSKITPIGETVKKSLIETMQKQIDASNE